MVEFISAREAIKHRWSREPNVRGLGQRLKKYSRPSTDFLRTDFLEAKAKDQGHNFSKLWSANLTLFLSVPELYILYCAQSWTALFRAFSSHRQPSAIFSKVFPAEQTSWPNWQTLMACREADG